MFRFNKIKIFENCKYWKEIVFIFITHSCENSKSSCGADTDILKLFATHSAKCTEFLVIALKICSSTSLAELGPLNINDPVKYLPFISSITYIIFLASNPCVTNSGTVNYLNYCTFRLLKGANPNLEKYISVGMGRISFQYMSSHMSQFNCHGKRKIDVKIKIAAIKWFKSRMLVGQVLSFLRKHHIMLHCLINVPNLHFQPIGVMNELHSMVWQLYHTLLDMVRHRKLRLFYLEIFLGCLKSIELADNIHSHHRFNGIVVPLWIIIIFISILF